MRCSLDTEGNFAISRKENGPRLNIPCPRLLEVGNSSGMKEDEQKQAKSSTWNDSQHPLKQTNQRSKWCDCSMHNSVIDLGPYVTYNIIFQRLLHGSLWHASAERGNKSRDPFPADQHHCWQQCWEEPWVEDDGATSSARPQKFDQQLKLPCIYQHRKTNSEKACQVPY